MTKNDKNVIPSRVPEKGYYYHYKHDPTAGFNNYAYEVLGVGIHSEDDCSPEDLNMVIYRPLYDSFVFTKGKFFDIRPLEMFMEEVNKDGKTFPRFIKITDKMLIEKFDQLKNEMYGGE